MDEAQKQEEQLKSALNQIPEEGEEENKEDKEEEYVDDMARLPNLNNEIDKLCTKVEEIDEIHLDREDVDEVFVEGSAMLIFKNLYEDLFKVLHEQLLKEQKLAKEQNLIFLFYLIGARKIIMRF